VNGPPSQLVGVELVLCQCVQEVAGLSRWVGTSNSPQSRFRVHLSRGPLPSGTAR
jgi:hypothetical protein